LKSALLDMKGVSVVASSRGGKVLQPVWGNRYGNPRCGHSLVDTMLQTSQTLSPVREVS